MRRGILIAGACWFLGMSACGSGHQAAENGLAGKEAAVVGHDSGAAVQPPNSADAAEFMPIKALWITAADALPLHEEPSTDGKVVATLPRNTILIFGGERKNENSTVMTKGKSYTGDWLRVKSIDPEAVGWLFAGKYRGEGLAEEVSPAGMVDAAEKAGRIIAPIPLWSTHETAQQLELNDLEPLENGYSGYYQFLRDAEGVEVLDGRFWVSSWGNDETGEFRLVCTGEYKHGNLNGEVKAVISGSQQVETITISHDAKGKFVQRKYTIEKGGKVITTYTDLENSLNRATILMD